MKPLKLALVAMATIITLVMVPAVRAQSDGGDQALLMEGRQTLFQRVLPRSTAILRASPDAGARQADSPPISAFTPLYVFARHQAGSDEWLAVSPSPRGGAKGWLQSDRAVAWDQSIVVTFQNPATRRDERTLMFESYDDLRELIFNSPARAVDDLREAAALSGSAGGVGPVVSIEPEEHISVDERFYILPILDFERVFPPRGWRRQSATALRVATLSRDQDAGSNDDSVDREALMADFRMGVVFVVDTTRSMQPYIDATREMMNRVNGRLAGSDAAEQIRYGLVGFRDSTSLSPDVGYVSRTYLPLAETSNGDALDGALGRMQAAQASTSGFSEDSLAGLGHAIDEMSWEKFDGRAIVLITDASPRTDEFSERRDGVPGIVRAAQDRNIALQTIHLRTPENPDDWSVAGQAYARASQGLVRPGLLDTVEVERTGEFELVADAVARSLTFVVEQAVDGALIDPEAMEPALDQELAFEGLAMQLAYLGRRRGVSAPDIVDGWMLDLNLTGDHEQVVDVRLMMTKTQLSSLAARLEIIAQQGDQLDDPSQAGDFFEDLRAAFGAAAADPNQLSDVQFDDLRDAASELLDGLPYESTLMSMPPEAIARMNAMERATWRERLRTYVRLYETLHDDTEAWHPPYEDAPDGEHLILLRLEDLP